MSCRSCASNNQTKLGSEILVHFPGFKNAEKPTVMVFPRLVVCLDCGIGEFNVTEAELRLLRQGAHSTAA